MDKGKIAHTYQDIEDVFSSYIHNKNDLALIRKAYDYADER